MGKELKQDTSINAAQDGSDTLKTERLSTQITKRLLNEIQTGMLMPGEKLPTEVELALKYGVSRTILREAIASLKNDDILEATQGRGLFVKNPVNRQAFRFSDVFETISAGDLHYFYEMRAALESQAAYLAAVRHTNKDMAEINAAYKGMELAVADKTLGSEAHSRYNKAIATASHNPVLIEFLSFLVNKLANLAKELRLRTMTSPDRAVTVLKEHKYVVECIASGDPEKSRDAVLMHLKNAAKRAGFKIYSA